jgi:hypothetical protein
MKATFLNDHVQTVALKRGEYPAQFLSRLALHSWLNFVKMPEFASSREGKSSGRRPSAQQRNAMDSRHDVGRLIALTARSHLSIFPLPVTP